jgi:hypothetical protein
LQRAVNDGKTEAIMLVPRSKHEAREREHADSLQRVEEASMSMQRTVEDQLAAESARRLSAELLVRQTMNAVEVAEAAKLKLRQETASMEERHASQMFEFRASVRADVERAISSRTAHLGAKVARLNAEVAEGKCHLENARSLITSATLELSDARDAMHATEGAGTVADKALVSTMAAAAAAAATTMAKSTAAADMELRRVSAGSELLKQRVAELEDAARLAKAVGTRELQRKRDAEAERDALVKAARNADATTGTRDRELARLSQLVRGESPKEDYEGDPQRASYAADAVAAFECTVRAMTPDDLVKLLRGNHLEHLRMREDLKRATHVLEQGQGLDAPQIALRRELRAAKEAKEILETEVRTLKSDELRYQAMEVERDHMKTQLSRAIFMQQKAEGNAGKARAFATQESVEKTRYAREVHSMGAQKRLLGALATGAHEDSTKDQLAAKLAAQSAVEVEKQALQTVADERAKSEVYVAKLVEMEAELRAERAKADTVTADMQVNPDEAATEVRHARRAQEAAAQGATVKIATCTAEVVPAVTSTCLQDRAGNSEMYSRERSTHQQAVRAIEEARMRSRRMMGERYLAHLEGVEGKEVKAGGPAALVVTTYGDAEMGTVPGGGGGGGGGRSGGDDGSGGSSEGGNANAAAGRGEGGWGRAGVHYAQIVRSVGGGGSEDVGTREIHYRPTGGSDDVDSGSGGSGGGSAGVHYGQIVRAGGGSGGQGGSGGGSAGVHYGQTVRAGGGSGGQGGSGGGSAGVHYGQAVRPDGGSGGQGGSGGGSAEVHYGQAVRPDGGSGGQGGSGGGSAGVHYGQIVRAGGRGQGGDGAGVGVDPIHPFPTVDNYANLLTLKP